MVCVEKITINFNNLKGTEKQPVAHLRSCAGSPGQLSILSIVPRGIEQHIVLRVLGHRFRLNSQVNMHTTTALLLFILESLAVLKQSKMYHVKNGNTGEMLMVFQFYLEEKLKEIILKRSFFRLFLCYRSGYSF